MMTGRRRAVWHATNEIDTRGRHVGFKDSTLDPLIKSSLPARQHLSSSFWPALACV